MNEVMNEIRCLVPDLPSAADLRPWLERIDANRWYTNHGPLLCEFEERMTAIVRGRDPVFCVGLASGMAALELGLRALNAGPGCRVLMPALTFPATAQAAVRCGAEPVFADVCPQRWILSPEIAREAMARIRVDAVVPVATFGCPLPAAEWDTLARDTGVPVLVDAAAALGQQRVGGLAHWAFSLHATKPFGIGEGGLFVTGSADLAERVRRIANFGFECRIVQVADGTNAKLSEYAAAVGLAQLERWPALLARRHAVFRAYRDALAELPSVSLQVGAHDAPATLCVLLPVAADCVAGLLARRGIETRRWYVPPLNRHPPFAGARCVGPDGHDRLPVTERLAERLLGLPFHTRLDAAAVHRIVGALRDALVASAGVASGGQVDAG